MIKRMTMLARRRDLSAAAFSAYWKTEHARVVQSVPGTHAYVQNHMVETVGARDLELRVDGVPELWFLDESGRDQFTGSPQSKLLPADEKNFLDGITILAVEEARIRSGEGGVKVLVFLRHADGRAADAAGAQHLCDAIASGLPSLRGLTMNRVTSAGGRDGVWREPAPPSLIVELRFDIADTDWRNDLGPAMARATAQEPGLGWAAYRVDVHPVVMPEEPGAAAGA